MDSDSAIQNFHSHVAAAVEHVQAIAPQSILLLHHNDADGLTSGAILERAFTRFGARVHRYSLEKPYPVVVRRLFSQYADQRSVLLVIADFGSGMLSHFREGNPHGHPVLVLDHHAISPIEDEHIFLVNPLMSGLSGKKDSSASAVCYQFAKQLKAWNADLLGLGIIGAVGDGQYSSIHDATGVNAELVKEAIVAGTLREENAPEICLAGEWHSIERIVRALNVLGSVGYYRGGPDIGIKALIDGFGAGAFHYVDAYEREYRLALDSFLSSFSPGSLANLQWFTLGTDFFSFGVKTVGLVCEELIARGVVSGESYLTGFQPIFDAIPGVGPLGISDIKVSMRVTPDLWKKIEAGERPSLLDVLPQATIELGGFVDACHPHAAATTIPAGSEERLIARLGELIAA